MVIVTATSVSNGHWVEVVEALVLAAEEQVMRTWGLEPELRLVSIEREYAVATLEKDEPAFFEYVGTFEVVGRVQ